MRLILVRHGVSHHSEQGIIAGMVGCTGLTNHGVKQAQVLARRLVQSREFADCTTLLSSPVRRARETANVLQTVLNVKSILEDIDLCELHPGIVDGMRQAAYREQGLEFDLLAFPDRPFSDGGESWNMFLTRMRMTLERLAAEYTDQTVIAVTHAGFIVASMIVLFGIPRPGTGTWMTPQHTSLTEWEYLYSRWQLVRYNDIFHLIT